MSLRRIENPSMGKGPQLIGVLFIILAIVSAFNGILELTLGLFALGILLIIGGKIEHWWWNK